MAKIRVFEWAKKNNMPSNVIITELKEKGIEFGYVMDDKEVKLAFFKDPDNNPLYVAQVIK